MNIYLVGPMRGMAERNFPAFAEAARRFRTAGWHVFSAAATTAALGYSSGPSGTPYPSDRRYAHQVMQIDIASIFAADAIGLLPGWERSYGSAVEVALGLYLGLDFYDAITLKRTAVAPLPWSALALPTVPATQRPPNEPAGIYSPQEKGEGPATSLGGISLVGPVDGVPAWVCSYCCVLLTSEDDRILTLDCKGGVTLCRACYDKAGSSVR